MSNAIDILKAAIASTDTATILETIRAMGGGILATTEERMTRAALIEVIAEREGTDASDAIMDEIGM